jgi:hypothetical protein
MGAKLQDALERDQLRLQRKAGAVFVGFYEPGESGALACVCSSTAMKSRQSCMDTTQGHRLDDEKTL